jgi:hypothetical protein
MNQQAKRIGMFEELDDKSICYWHSSGIWWLYLPGCGVGNLSNHKIEEHDDATITVSPSIKVTGHHEGRQTIRHGFLVRGKWQPCADDQQ